MDVLKIIIIIIIVNIIIIIYGKTVHAQLTYITDFFYNFIIFVLVLVFYFSISDTVA